MKTETRLAGLFASGGFFVTAVSGYFSTYNPLHALIYGTFAAIVLGFLGRRIGHIVAHPQGTENEFPPFLRDLFTLPGGRGSNQEGAQQGESIMDAGDGEVDIPVTGDETFIDDITTPESTS